MSDPVLAQKIEDHERRLEKLEEAGSSRTAAITEVLVAIEGLKQRVALLTGIGGATGLLMLSYLVKELFTK